MLLKSKISDKEILIKKQKLIKTFNKIKEYIINVNALCFDGSFKSTSIKILEDLFNSSLINYHYEHILSKYFLIIKKKIENNEITLKSFDNDELNSLSIEGRIVLAITLNKNKICSYFKCNRFLNIKYKDYRKIKNIIKRMDLISLSLEVITIEFIELDIDYTYFNKFNLTKISIYSLLIIIVCIFLYFLIAFLYAMGQLYLGPQIYYSPNAILNGDLYSIIPSDELRNITNLFNNDPKILFTTGEGDHLFIADRVEEIYINYQNIDESNFYLSTCVELTPGITYYGSATIENNNYEFIMSCLCNGENYSITFYDSNNLEKTKYLDITLEFVENIYFEGECAS